VGRAWKLGVSLRIPPVLHITSVELDYSLTRKERLILAHSSTFVKGVGDIDEQK